MGLWIIVGTTSFMATVFYLLNSLQMQSWLAKKLGNHLTASSGVSIVFESAIVPKFSLKRSTITFKNVYISRGPTREGQKEVVSQIMELEEPNDRLAVILNQDDSDPATSGVQQQKHEPITYTEKITHWWSTHIYKLATHGETIDQVDQEPNVDGTDKSKWTAFHMSIDEVEVALSLPRWLDGKGLIESAVVKGVRGVIGALSPFLPLEKIHSYVDSTLISQTADTLCLTRMHPQIDLHTAIMRKQVIFTSKI